MRSNMTAHSAAHHVELDTHARSSPLSTVRGPLSAGFASAHRQVSCPSGLHLVAGLLAALAVVLLVALCFWRFGAETSGRHPRKLLETDGNQEEQEDDEDISSCEAAVEDSSMGDGSSLAKSDSFSGLFYEVEETGGQNGIGQGDSEGDDEDAASGDDGKGDDDLYSTPPINEFEAPSGLTSSVYLLYPHLLNRGDFSLQLPHLPTEVVTTYSGVPSVLETEKDSSAAVLIGDEPLLETITRRAVIQLETSVRVNDALCILLERAHENFLKRPSYNRGASSLAHHLGSLMESLEVQIEIGLQAYSRCGLFLTRQLQLQWLGTLVKSKYFVSLVRKEAGIAVSNGDSSAGMPPEVSLSVRMQIALQDLLRCLEGVFAAGRQETEMLPIAGTYNGFNKQPSTMSPAQLVLRLEQRTEALSSLLGCSRDCPTRFPPSGLEPWLSDLKELVIRTQSVFQPEQSLQQRFKHLLRMMTLKGGLRQRAKQAVLRAKHLIKAVEGDLAGNATLTAGHSKKKS
ncbi:hypothetical protein Efla_004155 [Eimeria flavescens]